MPPEQRLTSGNTLFSRAASWRVNRAPPWRYRPTCKVREPARRTLRSSSLSVAESPGQIADLFVAAQPDAVAIALGPVQEGRAAQLGQEMDAAFDAPQVMLENG